MEAAIVSDTAAHYGGISPCLHCDAPAPAGKPFCCSGCEAAYALAQGAGISSAGTLFSAYAQPEADGYSLMLAVKGIHCASCIQLIENALLEEKDVTAARVNMSTGRLVVAWQGKKQRADALATIVAKLGYPVKPFGLQRESSGNEETSFLLRCIAIAGFAAGNIMLISVGLWTTDGETMGMATRDLFHWLSALIAFPTVLYAGRPFFASAWAVLRQGHTNMDVPISLGVLLACAMSLSETVQHGEHVYFDSAVMLLFFLLVGRYLDARAKGKARQSAQELLAMLAGTATVIENGRISVIPIRELREGMTVLVASGEALPADGTVQNGVSELDMSLITGETLPQSVQEGDGVFAGTINLAAPLRITVAKASDESLLSSIVKLMEAAEQGQARYVRLADRVAKLYTPVVHALALLTFLGWFLVMGTPWQPSLLVAITVLIITCPCALGLAVPVVQVLASGRLMKRGILLKSGDALEKLAVIHTAVFDKTGTLTLGKPEQIPQSYATHDLMLAASLAAHSKHPLSQALSRAYDGNLLDVGNVQEIPGKGIKAEYQGQTIRLGSRSWCGDMAAPSHSALELWLAVDGQPRQCFQLADTLRSDAADAIGALLAAGIRTVLLSGDREDVVRQMAEAVGIEDYRAALSPIEKCHTIETLRQTGNGVLMVGDGLNDAPSLAAADISMSPASAMDITQNTADIIFQGNNLMPVVEAWQTACDAQRLVKQNFALSVLYNLIAVPLAVMGYVTPLIAAAAMSGSSLVVIGNSFRLNRRKKH